MVTYDPQWPGDFVALAAGVIAGWGRPIDELAALVHQACDEQVRNAADPGPE